MRERVEDLGRLMVMIDDITKNRFPELPWDRTKDAEEMFFKLDKEKQSELIYKIAWAFQLIEGDLMQCWEIASGQDYLNDEPEVIKK